MEWLVSRVLHRHSITAPTRYPYRTAFPRFEPQISVESNCHSIAYICRSYISPSVPHTWMTCSQRYLARPWPQYSSFTSNPVMSVRQLASTLVRLHRNWMWHISDEGSGNVKLFRYQRVWVNISLESVLWSRIPRPPMTASQGIQSWQRIDITSPLWAQHVWRMWSDNREIVRIGEYKLFIRDTSNCMQTIFSPVWRHMCLNWKKHHALTDCIAQIFLRQQDNHAWRYELRLKCVADKYDLEGQVWIPSRRCSGMGNCTRLGTR